MSLVATQNVTSYQSKTCQWALLPWAQKTIHALKPECTDSS